MICAWKNVLNLLPPWMAKDVDRLCTNSLQELRMRQDMKPEIVMQEQNIILERPITKHDLEYCINAATRYSPWAVKTVSQGFITIEGGHRIGICGEPVIKEGHCDTMRSIRSVCIRIARDIPGLAAPISGCTGSILILGAPGWGKTTLLRDLIRQKSQRYQVSVVDERQELFPDGMSIGLRTDILSGVRKSEGIIRLLRTMGPEFIAVDEITSPEDCTSIIQAVGCGIKLLATAHAASLDEFQTRPVYKSLLKNCVFDHAVLLRRDKQFTVERMIQWT